MGFVTPYCIRAKQEQGWELASSPLPRWGKTKTRNIGIPLVGASYNFIVKEARDKSV